ncbi:MAG: NADPH:quinone reductase, partial [Aeromicrobium sp.]|nr:NADPH:quinone reductase [Aeromicrobium sp.]
LGEPPFTVGWDVAGTVDAVGPDVTEHAVGDRVFGMPRFPAAADAYAEQVVAPVQDVVTTPATTDDQHAAALPLAALTAYQALVEVADVQPGQRVLVQAAGGGVGHLAVQIAKALGAEVVATASAGKVDFVRGLGADQVVDYREHDFTEVVEPVDVVVDPFGGENLARSLAVVRDGGVVASLLDIDPEAAATAEARGVRLVRIGVGPNRTSLQAIAGLVDRGLVAAHVSATYPLEEAATAHEQIGHGVQGKIVLVP